MSESGTNESDENELSIPPSPPVALPACKYGKSCYRRNPSHFEHFSHPVSDKKDSSKRSQTAEDDGGPSTSKSAKIDQTEHDEVKKWQGKLENDYGFYLTTVTGIDSRWNEPSIAKGIKDILSMDEHAYEASVQFNYMIDLHWLMEQYPDASRNKPLLVVSSDQSNDWIGMREAAAKHYTSVQFAKAPLYMPYGTHHTKMMLLKYTNGMRVVIHTANLIETDWHQKTQGIYLSPLFLNQKTGSSNSSRADNGSDTNFKEDLLDYLRSYRLKALDTWMQHIQDCDMTSARVYLIGSAPGRHTGANLRKYGHLKLRKILSQHVVVSSTRDKLIAQFSSIGSLGSSPDKWLEGEFATTMSTGRSQTKSTDMLSVAQKCQLSLVFPSVDNVRRSLEGYPAGGSLPYGKATAIKQPYLNKFFNQWKCDRFGRTQASPHIKCYMRTNDSSIEVYWFLLSSANLSKAAWGCFEKNNSQLMIRSYELGVLFVPSCFEKDTNRFLLTGPESFPIPLDLPLTSYSKTDEPWIVDKPYLDFSDSKGNLWNPS